MKKILLPKNMLFAGLLLVSVHSFFVGIGLIFAPSRIMEIFGFTNGNDSFFRYQGGVFHIIMSYAYTAGALNPFRNEPLIKFSIVTKFTAALFLFLFYSFVLQIKIILFSGLGDLFLAALVLFLFSQFKRFNNNAVKEL